MFRELFYGLLFYLSAVVGGVLGLVFLTPTTSHGVDETAEQAAIAIIVGAIAGSGTWLWFKYTHLSPKLRKPSQSPWVCKVEHSENFSDADAAPW